MNWVLELAKAEFGLGQIESFPDLAAQALDDGFDSPSLCTLAGLSLVPTDNEEIRSYLRLALQELRIEWPSKEKSALILLHYFIDQIIDGSIEPHEGIHTIIWNIYHQMDWCESDNHYAGDSIHIERLYGLCDTYDDLSEATVRWDKHKTNDELKMLIQQEIRAEAEVYKDKYLAQLDNQADGK